MGRASPSSSIDSSNNHLLLLSPSSSPSSSSSSICHSSNHATSSRSRRDLSTDLRLGLSLSPARSQREASSILTQRDHQQGLVDCWPPIKPLLRSTLAGKPTYDGRQPADSLFVKVYMEGIPIGRKLDLFRHEDYDDLVTTLARMFKTNILRPNGNRVHSDKYHVLTYEDKDGDWMMVGDVPWEMFVTTVKRLKITRADRC